jgi:hypothetical protein
MVYFQAKNTNLGNFAKNTNLGNFGKVLQWKVLVYLFYGYFS